MNIPKTRRINRNIDGRAAMLLPFHLDDRIDFDAFLAHLERAWAAGLTPAVNMDTGFVDLLSNAQRREILEETAHAVSGRLFIGNDLAIDMVMYGSDYLLGLATFAPEAFARRDRYWQSGDPRFYELNDLLQYLGRFAFRPPTPAYKHSALQFLRLRGLIPPEAAVHPGSMRRPESDLLVLQSIIEQLEQLLSG